MVCNGWAADLETWSLTEFQRDWTFNYLEQLDGLPDRILPDFHEVLIVGFSMGSTTALRLLCKFPDCIRGLVLVSATPRMMADENWAGFSTHRLAAFRLGTEMLFQGNPSPIYARKNLQRGLDYLERTDLRADLQQLRISEFGKRLETLPVEVLHSDRDGIVRPHNVQYFQSLFPRARVTMIPGSEHVLPVSVPELVDQAVNRCILELGGVI